MPIDINERIDATRRNSRRRLNLDEITAVLGRTDTNAVANTRMPGCVWVSIYANGGMLSFRSARAPTKYFTLDPNTPVKLKYDVRGRLQVDEPDADAQLTTGVDPVGQATQQSSNSTPQSNFETLRVVQSDTPDLTVWVKAWKIYGSGSLSVFSGIDVNMTSYVPSSGNMLYAMIALKNDYATIEVTTSTARSIADIDLNVDDENECIALLTAGSTPIWAIKLIGGQTTITQSDIDLDGQDERQLVNNTPSSGSLTNIATGTGLSGGPITSTGTIIATPTYKIPARVVAISNVTIAAPGSTIDGVTMATNDRVLLTGQSTPSQNGLWIWNGAAVAMTRPIDFAAASTVLAFLNITVYITAGSTGKLGSFWRLTTTGTVTIDSTLQTWAQVAFAINSGSVDTTPVGSITPSSGAFTTLNASGVTTLQSGEVHKVRVVTAAGAVTVATTDYFVDVNKTVGAATLVNLPGTPTTGLTFVIHDGKGDAATNNLTVTPAAGNINGAATLVINTAYGSAIVTYNGTQWDAIVSGSGGSSGDVTGPASAVPDDFVMFNGSTGKIIKDNGTSLSTDGTLSSNSNSLIPSQAAVKAYVDATIAGKSAKDSVVLATTAALASNTYVNGVSGVGATLTGVATGVLTIDSVAVTAGMRLLIKDESAGSHNGIYQCTIAGAIGVAYVLTRTTDSDTSAEIIGSFMFAEQGTANADKGFVNTNTSTITMGTTAITYSQFSGNLSSPLTTKGDIWGYNTTNDRIPVSGANGNVLTEDSTNALGVSWQSPGALTSSTTRGSIVRNGTFAVWERGTTTVPDNWVLTGASATVAQEGTIVKFGSYSLKLTRSGTDCNVMQDIYTYAGSVFVRSRQYTIGAWVYATVASRVRLRADDGVTVANSSYHSGGSTWEWITLTYTPGAAVTTFKVGIQVDGGNTSGYLDALSVVEGATITSGYYPSIVPVNQIPQRATMWGDAFNAPVTITRGHDANQNYATYIFQTTTRVDGQEFTSSFFLKGGTYNLVLLTVKNTDSCKFDVYIDGVQIGTTQDTYAASLTYNNFITLSSASVAGDGYHQLKLKINGKNASSSSFVFYLTKVEIYPTAD